MTWRYTRTGDLYVCQGMCKARVCNPPWYGANTGPELPRCPVIGDYSARHDVCTTSSYHAAKCTHDAASVNFTADK
jgi:hypothetical protein